MKSTLFLSAATLLFSAAQAQVTDSTTQSQNTGSATMNSTTTSGNTDMNTTMVDASHKLNNYGSYSTRDSIAAKYKLLPMPGALSTEKTFPILGTYQLNDAPAADATTATDATTTTADQTTDVAATSAASPTVTITMDSASKGIVWVEGLQQGRLKAYLKKSPATYRITAQKSGSGTTIPEGVMMLDTATHTLNIALGASYNEADPAAIFATGNTTTVEDNTTEVKTTAKAKTKHTTKAKPKVTFITATKVDAAQQMQDGQMEEDAATESTQQSSQQGEQKQ